MEMLNNFIGLTLQLSVPIVLGALCGTIAERGGIILLGVEGIMLVGAFAGVLGSYATGWALAGVVLSLVLGGLIGWFYALFCLKWKAHQSVVGVGINLFASGITAVMLKAVWQTEGMSESVASIPNLTIPGLSGIPVLGALFKEQSPYLYAMFLIVAGVWVVFYKTKFGLRYRAMGDQPYAVQTAGVPVNRYRYTAMILAGSIAGLAANIFGGWQPLGSMGAGMIFAIAQAARFYLTDLSIPSQFVQMLPYAVTLVVLLFVGKRVKGPEALGKLVD